MAWCPVCKCEYKEGITKCADCKVELVDSLENVDVSELTEEETIAVAEELLGEEATENKNIHFIDREAEIPTVRIAKKTGAYRKSSELSGENKASAYMLLIIGILGVVAIGLIWLDVIPIYHSLASKISSSAILGTLFIVFIIMGIVSMKNARKFEAKAIVEGDLTKEIKAYFSENYSKDIIEKALSSNPEWKETPEEMKYFYRAEYMKKLINDKFMNLDEDYVDYICDELYTELFEE